MAFWSKWFAPTCDGCGEGIVGAELVADGDRELCPSCHAAVVEAQRAAIEARRAEEEAARQKLEASRAFGVDPRSRS